MCAWRLAAHASALGGCPALGQHVIAYHMSPPARVVYTMGHVASGPWSITAKHWGLGFAPRATTTICVAWGKSLPLLPRFAYLESGDDHRQLDVGRLEECTQLVLSKCLGWVWHARQGPFQSSHSMWSRNFRQVQGLERTVP